MFKNCALKTEIYKKKTPKYALDFLSQYNDGGDDMLSRVVIGDETVVSVLSLDTLTCQQAL